MKAVLGIIVFKSKIPDDFFNSTLTEGASQRCVGVRPASTRVSRRHAYVPFLSSLSPGIILLNQVSMSFLL